MQRTFFVQAGVCGIRILQNFVAEKGFFFWSDKLTLLAQESGLQCGETGNFVLSLTQNDPATSSQ